MHASLGYPPNKQRGEGIGPNTLRRPTSCKFCKRWAPGQTTRPCNFWRLAIGSVGARQDAKERIAAYRLLKRSDDSDGDNDNPYDNSQESLVGTLKDGYICRVPLPRVPRIQSTSPVACATNHRNHHAYTDAPMRTSTHPTSNHAHTGYSLIVRIPTWSDMIESLSGFGRCIERCIPPFSPVRLM